MVRLLATGKPAAGMPSFTVLRSDEVTALIAYIRSLTPAKEQNAQ